MSIVGWLLEKFHLGPDYEDSKEVTRTVTVLEKQVNATAQSREKAMDKWAGLVSAGEAIADLTQREK